MRSLAIRLSDATRALGLPGVFGVALIVFAAMLYLSAINAKKAELGQLLGDAAELRQRQKGVNKPVAESSPADRLNSFYSHIPASTELQNWLHRFYEIAARRGISLESGDYTLAAEPAAKVLRYQINLPLKGGYVQQRSFIANVLDEMPAMALEQIEWRRESISTNVVDSKIRFVLFLHQK